MTGWKGKGSGVLFSRRQTVLGSLMSVCLTRSSKFSPPFLILTLQLLLFHTSPSHFVCELSFLVELPSDVTLFVGAECVLSPLIFKQNSFAVRSCANYCLAGDAPVSDTVCICTRGCALFVTLTVLSIGVWSKLVLQRWCCTCACVLLFHDLLVP